MQEITNVTRMYSWLRCFVIVLFQCMANWEIVVKFKNRISAIGNKKQAINYILSSAPHINTNTSNGLREQKLSKQEIKELLKPLSS